MKWKRNNSNGAPQNNEKPLPPEGIYKVNVLNCEEKTSQAGNAMWVLQLEIAQGGFQGTQLRDWIVESIGWKVNQFLESLERDLPEGDEADLNANDYIGTTARVRIVHTKKDDKTYLNVKRWLKVGEPETPQRKPLSAQQRAMQQRHAERNRPAPEPPDDDLLDDEVPF